MDIWHISYFVAAVLIYLFNSKFNEEIVYFGSQGCGATGMEGVMWGLGIKITTLRHYQEADIDECYWSFS